MSSLKRPRCLRPLFKGVSSWLSWKVFLRFDVALTAWIKVCGKQQYLPPETLSWLGERRRVSGVRCFVGPGEDNSDLAGASLSLGIIAIRLLIAVIVDGLRSRLHH